MSGRVEIPVESVAVPEPADPKKIIGKPRPRPALAEVFLGPAPTPEGLCTEDDPIAKHFPRAIVCGPIAAELCGVDIRDSYERHIERARSTVLGTEPENVWAQRRRRIVVTYEHVTITAVRFQVEGVADLGTLPIDLDSADFARLCGDAKIEAERALSARVARLVADSLKGEGLMCHCDPHKRTPCCGPDCCGVPGGCAFCKKSEKPRAWFLTMSGQQFFYDEPEAYKFSVEEIAHVLGNLCRFNGNLPRFYSVAEHSVHVLNTVREIVSNPDPDFLRYALMHDGSESVLLDIPRPMKRLPWMAEYRALEVRVERAIARQLGFLEATEMVGTDPVKVADAMVLRAEKDQLRGAHGYQSSDAKVEAARVTCMCLPPEKATALFLAAWRGIQ